MRRSARHNYRDRRHAGRCVDVTERAVQKSVSGAQGSARAAPTWAPAPSTKSIRDVIARLHAETDRRTDLLQSRRPPFPYWFFS